MVPAFQVQQRLNFLFSCVFICLFVQLPVKFMSTSALSVNTISERGWFPSSQLCLNFCANKNGEQKKRGNFKL